MLQRENTDLLCLLRGQTDGCKQSLPRHHEHCSLAPLSRVPYSKQKQTALERILYGNIFAKLMPDTKVGMCLNIFTAKNKVITEGYARIDRDK